MAIATNDTIEKFGTQDEITSSPSTVTDTSYSVAGDVAQWTNSDDAPFGYFALKLTAAGLGGVPTAGSTVDLYTRLIGVVPSPDTDQLAPQADFDHYYLGSFPIENQDADQVIVIGPIRLPNTYTSQVHEFYIKNNCGQALGTTWELFVTPTTFGPAA